MPATSETLTAERILEATEEVLRRHGPAKATVVDVARALGVSHGSVYRHFRTKAALREAVTKRWLDRATRDLAGIAADAARDPEARVREWLAALFAAKRRKAGGDPELFATYSVLVDEAGEVVSGHIAELTGQLTEIVRAGAEAGAFAVADPATVARALFQATARFHDPGYATEWERPGVEGEFEAVVDLLVRGLRRSAEPAGVLFGLAIACFIAAYTLVDKYGIRYAAPFVYLELSMLLSGLGYSAAIVRLRGRAALRAEWGWATVAAGLATFGAYGFVLAALQRASAASVAAVRETSIVIAAAFAALVLKEPVGPERLAGAVLVATGVAILSL